LRVSELDGVACRGGAEGEGEIAVRWLGGIFLLALIAITFAVYSDIVMTRCALDRSLPCWAGAALIDNRLQAVFLFGGSRINPQRQHQA